MMRGYEAEPHKSRAYRGGFKNDLELVPKKYFLVTAYREENVDA